MENREIDGAACSPNEEVGFFFSNPIAKKIPPNFAVPVDGRVYAIETLAECTFPMKCRFLLNPSICGNRHLSL